MSARSLLVKSLPCTACEMDGFPQQSPTEEHHLNQFGLAGKKRLGDDYSIPLCAGHHRGILPLPHGPSLARSSRLFRMTYGNDDVLLAITNDKLKAVA